MASPIVLSSDESDDEVVVVCETKCAPKAEDEDVVFLSIEKPQVDVDVKTDIDHINPVDTDNSGATSVDADNSVVSQLDADYSGVSPVNIDNSAVTSVDIDNSGVTPVNIDNFGVTPVNIDNSGVTPVNIDNSAVTPVDTYNSGVTPVDTYNSGVTPVDTYNSGVTHVDTYNSGVTHVDTYISGFNHVNNDNSGVIPVNSRATPTNTETGEVTLSQAQISGVPANVTEADKGPVTVTVADNAGKSSLQSADQVDGDISPLNGPNLWSKQNACAPTLVKQSADSTTGGQYVAGSSQPSDLNTMTACAPLAGPTLHSLAVTDTSRYTCLTDASYTAGPVPLITHLSSDDATQSIRNWLLPQADSSLFQTDFTTPSPSCKPSLSRSLSYSSPYETGKTSSWGSGSLTPVCSSPRNVPPRKRLRSDGQLIRPVSAAMVSAAWSTRCCVCGEEGRKVSHCMQKHQTCCICMEDRAKYLLSDKKGTTLKCLSSGCDSFYPISELKHTLPGMVVDVLEIQLEKYYVDSLADMVMKQVTGGEHQPDIAPTDLLEEESNNTASGKTKDEIMEVPSSWVEMDPHAPFQLVQLEPETEAYMSVSLKFHETMQFGTTDIEKIFRVQNPILWKFYSVKKQQMSQDHGGEMVNEKLLFHGTNDEAVDAICKSGFDWRLCGKHGTMYGQGSYFAQTASYSHQYSAAAKVNKSRKHSLNGSFPRRCKLNKLLNMSNSPFALPHALRFILPTGTTSTAPPVGASYNSPASGGGVAGLTTTQMAGPPYLASLPLSTPVSQSPSSTGTSTHTSVAQSQTLTWPPLQPNPLNLSMGDCASSAHTPSSTVPPNVSVSPATPATSLTPLALPPQIYPHSHHQALSFRCRRRIRIPARQAAGLGLSTSTSFGGTGSVQSSGRVSPGENEAQVFKMFLARVLVGKYTTGNNGLRKPPPLDASADPYGMCFDSCVDNVSSPKIYVVFDSAQAYPEYIVHYKQNS